MGGLSSKEKNFENLSIFSKKKILRATINFQGYPTTFLELIENDLSILNELTNENIKQLLDNRGELTIGKALELRLNNKLVQRKFVPESYDFRQNHFNNCEDDKMTYNQIKTSKLVVLSDHANSGKSVTFKYFALSLKYQNKLHWVSYIELRRYRRIFDFYANKVITTDEVHDILTKLIGLTSQLEFRILRNLLLKGNAILLFDGIDELIPEYTNIFKKFFEIFSLSCYSNGNRLWISTRPNMSSSYQQILENQNDFRYAPFMRPHQEAYKFAPFTKTEKKNIIMTMIEVGGIDDWYMQTMILDEVMTYLDHMKSDDGHGKDINNLFMIQSITEYYIKNVPRLKLNSYYEVFAAMIETQKSLLKIQPKECDNDSILNIWDVHRAVSLLQAFPLISLDSFTILRKWRRDKKNWTSDVIQRYGFMNGNLNLSMNFVHKSYADFFVAQFIINFLYGDNEEMDIEEIKSMVSLFTRIMCNFINDRVCCKFIISYFKKYGCERKVSENVKQVIYENLREIQDPTCHRRLSADVLKNYAIFMSSDPEMMRKLFKLDEDINLLDEYVLKGWMETYSSTFMKAVNASLGPNWHEKFNKSPRKLVTHDLIDFFERKHKDHDFIKICDLYYNSDNSEAKNRFLNTFYRLPCYNGFIQVEIISRMKLATRDKFVEECFIKACYDHITPQAISLIFESITELFTERKIYEILFQDYSDFTSPLILSLHVENPEIFKLTKSFYIKHTRSWDEIQNIFLFGHVKNLFIPCTRPVYELYMEFMQTVFGTSNKWQIKGKIMGHVLTKGKLDVKLKCNNSKDFLSWLFPRSVELKTLDNIFEKVFKHG